MNNARALQVKKREDQKVHGNQTVKWKEMKTE